MQHVSTSHSSTTQNKSRQGNGVIGSVADVSSTLQDLSTVRSSACNPSIGLVFRVYGHIVSLQTINNPLYEFQGLGI